MPLTQELKAMETRKSEPAKLFFGAQALFNTGYFVFTMLYLPVFLKKIQQAESPSELVRQRLGNIPENLQKKLAGKKVIWVHSVSVGETMAVRTLVQELLKQYPEHSLVITTVTPTGQKIAKQMENDRISVIYFPFDFSFVCARFFRALNPEALLLAETEIWPNLLTEAGKAGVPVGILNARLSEKSASRYGRFGFLFRPLFETLNFVLAQDETDAGRFRALGVPQERLLTAGNLKFDNVSLTLPDAQRTAALKQEWGFHASDRIWICGSTHPKEETVLFEAFQKLKKDFPDLKMLLAPRHIERSETIASELRGMGLRAQRATLKNPEEPFDVLILDQLGTLKILYQIADAVYVGGSLVKRGGQNPIEPASYQKPVVHGPYVFNFDKIYRDLDQKNGALPVRGETELITTIRDLLTKPGESQSRGRAAFEVIRSLQGATKRHLDGLSSFLTLRSQERIQDVQNYDKKLFPPSGGGL